MYTHRAGYVLKFNKLIKYIKFFKLTVAGQIGVALVVAQSHAMVEEENDSENAIIQNLKMGVFVQVGWWKVRRVTKTSVIKV
jgi:hypothetical protein